MPTVVVRETLLDASAAAAGPVAANVTAAAVSAAAPLIRDLLTRNLPLGRSHAGPEWWWNVLIGLAVLGAGLWLAGLSVPADPAGRGRRRP